MNALTRPEIERLAAVMDKRKLRLREEIREGLDRTGSERYADLLSGTADAGDESVASLLTDVAHAEVARDVRELRDIAAAERRMATDVYGICIDCGGSIDYKRLDAYPTAKRCLSCQQIHEKTHSSSGPSRF
jgi:RNA polymerase-binding transcription factor DksA